VSERKNIVSRIWDEATDSLTEAVGFFQSRRIKPKGADLRYHYGVKWKGHEYPALLCRIYDPRGRVFALNAMLLDSDEAERRIVITDPDGGGWRVGSAVHVYPYPEEDHLQLGVTVGVANAIAVSNMLPWNLPVWAVLGPGSLSNFRPPSECSGLFVFGLPTKDFTGHRSAYYLAARSFKEGLSVSVEFPSERDVEVDWLSESWVESHRRRVQ